MVWTLASINTIVAVCKWLPSIFQSRWRRKKRWEQIRADMDAATSYAAIDAAPCAVAEASAAGIFLRDVWERASSLCPHLLLTPEGCQHTSLLYSHFYSPSPSPAFSSLFCTIHTRALQHLVQPSTCIPTVTCLPRHSLSTAPRQQAPATTAAKPLASFQPFGHTVTTSRSP